MEVLWLAWGWCHEGSLVAVWWGFVSFGWLAGGSGGSYWNREDEHGTVGGCFVGMEMLCVGNPWCLR